MSVLLADVEGVLMPAPDPQEDRAAALLALLALINRDRAALGRRELLPDDQLHWLAQYRAEVVAATGHYAHESPTGETAAGIMAALGGPERAWVYENLWSCAAWLSCSAAVIHQVFMESPGHRDAVLVPEHTHIGLGLAHNEAGDLLIVELFARQEAVPWN